MKKSKLFELFIQVKGIGFAFLLNREFKYSLISPAFLSFFSEEYPPTEEEYKANQMAVDKIIKESEEVFTILPEHLKTYLFKDVFINVGSGIARCSDGKLRRCKTIKFNFEHEGHSYSELFHIDRRLSVAAILGSTFLRKYDVRQLKIESTKKDTF